jgi:hypothetical protein
MSFLGHGMGWLRQHNPAPKTDPLKVQDRQVAGPKCRVLLLSVRSPHACGGCMLSRAVNDTEKDEPKHLPPRAFSGTYYFYPLFSAHCSFRFTYASECLRANANSLQPTSHSTSAVSRQNGQWVSVCATP